MRRLLGARGVDDAEAGQPTRGDRAEREVVGDGQLEDEAGGLAVLGDVREPGGDRVARRADRELATVDAHPAGDRAPRDAEQRGQRRRASGAHGTRERDDLAGIMEECGFSVESSTAHFVSKVVVGRKRTPPVETRTTRRIRRNRKS